MQLPEIVAAGIYDSKVVAKNIVISQKRTTSVFEIELPLCDGGISYIDSGAKPITPNMIICAKPGQQRHTKFPYKCYFVHMNIHDGELYDLLMSTPDVFETGKSHVYKSIFKRINKYYHTPAGSEYLLLQSLLLELVYTISKDSGKTVKSGSASNRSQIIEQSLSYIKEHLTEDLSLAAVSESVSLSPIYFHNIFKASVGKTLRDYIEEKRIEKAIHLLMTTDCTLTQIAFDCGFSSQSYFSYVFKRRMEKTPREYVQEIAKKYEL